MRLPATAASAALAGLGWLAVLCQPAHAQRVGLGFLQPTARPEGSRLELATPDGTACRFNESERPTLSLGVGVADAPVLPGIYGIEQAYPADTGDPQPVGGVVLRIPLGKSQQNCDSILKTESAMNKLRKAQEMFENGLIDDVQLKRVADQTYAILSQP